MKLIEESPGVFAIKLYQANSTRRMVSYLKREEAWMDARVLRGKNDGSSADVKIPSVRTADILAPNRGLSLYRDFERRMVTVIKPLINRIWRIRLKEHTAAQIIRYKPGGHYIAHSDGGYFFKERYFTVLCYLNDDFEGGNTQFPGLGYSTVPERGKAILFPSRYVHRAEPVIVGEKYVIISWITGPIPIAWI